MKNLLFLLGAVAMTTTFSMADSKYNSKADTTLKCGAGKISDKKMGEKYSSGEEDNRTKVPVKESAKCGKGKCG